VKWILKGPSVSPDVSTGETPAGMNPTGEKTADVPARDVSSVRLLLVSAQEAFDRGKFAGRTSSDLRKSEAPEKMWEILRQRKGHLHHRSRGKFPEFHLRKSPGMSSPGEPEQVKAFLLIPFGKGCPLD
jgi:hypothetical protein